MEEQKDEQDHKIHIAVENFGPIEKAEIDLRPLTIFVGESNTGKTYLAALIYAIQRAFEGIPEFLRPITILQNLIQFIMQAPPIFQQTSC